MIVGKPKKSTILHHQEVQGPGRREGDPEDGHQDVQDVWGRW